MAMTKRIRAAIGRSSALGDLGDVHTFTYMYERASLRFGLDQFPLQRNPYTCELLWMLRPCERLAAGRPFLSRLCNLKRDTRRGPPTAPRRYATVTSLSHYPRPGEQLHGFTLKRTKHVPELQLIALLLQHDKSGAEHLHVARDDKNNVFSIGFKTNPPDDTGVPHILEHTTLCGSEK